MIGISFSAKYLLSRRSDHSLPLQRENVIDLP